MIWILGASGYIGEAFVAEAKRRKLDYRPVSRKVLDYTDFRTLLAALKKEEPKLVINAARFIYHAHHVKSSCSPPRKSFRWGRAVFYSLRDEETL